MGRAPAARRPRPGGDHARRSSPTWRPGPPRCGCVLGDGGPAGRRPAGGARRRLPRPRAGRAGRRRPDRRGRGGRCCGWPPSAATPPTCRQPRRRPDRRGGPAPAPTPTWRRSAALAAAAPATYPKLRVVTVDAHRLPRRGRRRRRGARRVAAAVGVAYLRALDRRRADASTTALRAARVPLRRDAPTSSPRSPSCAPPGGCGRGSPSCAARADAGGAAPARGHVGGDDDPARPVGEHAAHDDRLLRRRRRRRRRDHRAAVRRARSGCRTTSPGASPATPSRAARRVEPGPGHRRGRRVLVRRVAHRRARRSAAWDVVHRDRAGRRARRRARRRAGRRPIAATVASGAATTSRTAARRSPA